APEQSGRQEGERAQEAGEHELARPDQEEASEEKRLDVRPRVEDVAREDDPEGERADEDERREAPVVGPARAPEQADGEAEDDRCSERTERGGEREAVREDEARKRRGPDRVRVEGEAAQDDPGSDEAGADREQEHLPDSPLHEGVLKGR